MRRLTGDILAIERHGSLGGANEAGDGFEQRGLAGAIRPDQADDFVAFEVERHLVDRPQTAEPARDPTDLQQRRNSFCPPRDRIREQAPKAARRQPHHQNEDDAVDDEMNAGEPARQHAAQ